MAIECYQLAFRNAGYYETKNKAAYLSFEAFALNKLERFAEALDRANEALRYDSGNSFAKEQRTTAVELPVKIAEELNVKGNEHCANSQFVEAIECYQLAGKYVLGNKVSRSSYLSHEAFALNKLARYHDAYTKASESLALNANNEFAKDQLTDAADQMQSTQYSYDCEGKWLFSNCRLWSHKRIILKYTKNWIGSGSGGKKCNLGKKKANDVGSSNIKKRCIV